MIPLMHVERTDDPDVARWVVHDDRLRQIEPFGADRDDTDDSPLAAHVFENVAEVCAIEVGHLRVDVRKTPRGDWQTLAPRVQAILREAFEAGIPLTTRGSARASRATEVADAIDDAIGAIVAAHRGAIEVVHVGADCVTVRLHGACSGCPGARSTVEHALDSELRRRFPELRKVTTIM